MSKHAADLEIPAELLGVILSLSWSVQPQKRGNSQIRFWWPPKGEDGAQFRAVSTGVRTDKISKDAQTKAVAAWFQKMGFKPKPKPQDGAVDFPLEERIAGYLAAEYQGAPKGTTDTVEKDLRRMREALAQGCKARMIPPVTTLRAITVDAFDAACDTVLKFKEDKPKEPLKKKSWRGMLGTMRKFFRYHREWGPEGRAKGEKWMAIDPTINQPLPTKAECAPPKKKAWPDDEFDRTVEAIKDKDKERERDARESLILLRHGGGLDECDVFALHEDHIVPDGDRLRIVKLRGKHKRSSASEWIKMPVARKIEPMIRRRLKEAKARGGFIFSWQQRYSSHVSFDANLYKIVKKARKSIGLPMIPIKALRHTFATEHIRKGKAKPWEISKWLGHVDGSKQLQETYNLWDGEAANID